MPEAHAITRARERYGIELTTHDLRTIQRMVQTGKTLKLSRTPDGAEHHALMWGDMAMVVVVGTNSYVMSVLPRRKYLSGAGRKRAAA